MKTTAEARAEMVMHLEELIACINDGKFDAYVVVATSSEVHPHIVASGLLHDRSYELAGAMDAGKMFLLTPKIKGWSEETIDAADEDDGEEF